MNDPREPNYYEIALTSRQAFTAFILLLICVVASFFAGLWVGHSGPGAGASATTEIQVAQNAEDAPQLEEVKFFGEADQAGEPAEPGAEKATEKPQNSPAKPTLLDQLAAGKSPSASPEASGDRPRQAAKRRPRKRPAAPPAQEETAKPAPEQAPAAEPVEAAPTPAVPLPSGDQVIIQVFSSGDQAQAARVFERLRADGYPSYVEPIQEQGKALYRVRIGPYESKAAAEPVAAEVRRKHHLDTWITSAGG